MIRLYVYDVDFRPVGYIDHADLGHLLHLGKVLQRKFGAYFRLDFRVAA